MLGVRALEALDVTPRDGGPLHPHAIRRRALAHRVAPRVVAQQAAHLAGDGSGISPRDQDAAPVGEQLAGVAVRRRDDGPARAHRVRERSGRDLLRLEVGRDVDVRGGQVVGELALADEAVVEDHVRVHAEAARAALEHDAVRLAVVLLDVRVRRAQDHVDRVRVVPQDVRERVDDVLDALVRRQQAEGEDDRFALDAEQLLAAWQERQAGDSVGDAIDAPLGHAVNLAQQRRGVITHDDDALGEAHDLVHHAALLGIGLAEDRVQGRDDGNADLAQEGEQVAACRASEDPVLVLHAEDVGRAQVQEARGAPVGGVLVLGQLEADARGVGVVPPDVVHRDHEHVAGGQLQREGLAQVGREGGDAALPGRMVAEQRDLAHRPGGAQGRR